MKTLSAFLPINKNLICNGIFLLLFSSQGITAQIALRGAATTATATTNTVAINKPTGVVAGDIMMANVVGNLNSGATIVTGPTGWTTIAGTAIERGFATLFYRIANATDASVTSYTFTTTTGSNPSNGAIVAFSGVDIVAPFEGTQPTVWTTATATSISTLPSITTVNPGAALVQFGSAGRITSTANANFTSWSLSSTELYDFGSGACAVGAAWATRFISGLTGAGGFTCSPNTNSRSMGGIMITLSPALQFRSAASGSWSTPSTWQQSNDAGATWITAVSVPTAGDISATIRTGHTVTLSAAASSPALTIDAGGTLTSGSNMLTMNNDFVNNGTLTSGSGGITIAGNDSEQNISGFTTTGNVSMTKTAGTATFIGNINGAGLTMNGNGGTLNLGIALTHTFTGTWTRTNGTLQGGSSLVRIAGNVSGSTGTFTAGTGTVVYNGTAQTAAVVTYNNLTLSGSGSKTFATTPTVNGILSLEETATVIVSSGVVTYGSGATLQYNNRGTYTGTTEECTLTATTNLVLFGISTITLPANQALNSLTVNFGATLTLAARQLTINGAVTNDGSINASTGRLNQVAAATGDFANTGSIVFTGAGQVALTRNFTNTGTFILLSTPVTILGANTQSIAGFTTTGTVTMTKTAGTATFIGNVNGAGLTMNGNGGTLNLGTGRTHTFTGNITLTAGTLHGGSSTLNVNATSGTAWNGTGSLFTSGTGTVIFGGAAQTILASATTFNNLRLSSSGSIKTFGSVITVNGNLIIDSGVKVNLGTGLNHTAANLTMGGFGTAAGSYGSTSSTAANKTNTFFEATTGIVTAQNSSCAALAAVFSGTSAICLGGNTNLAITITGGLSPYTIVYSGTTINSYLSGSAINVNPAITTNYVLTSATDSYGCLATISGSLTVTVNTNSTAAVLSGTSTICSGTANLQVAITGGTSPYTVVYSNGTSNATINSYISGSNISVSPTSTTTYTLVSVTSAKGCVGTGNTGSATVTFGDCVTWNGSAWINGPPTSISNLIFEGNYNVPSNLAAYSIVVNSGSVTIPSGVNITLAGPITVNGGSFTVESNANLIQTNVGSNSGNITVRRNTSMLKRQDYVLWSSPTVGQQLQSFSPETLSNRFYTYDASTNLYTVVIAPSTTNFSVGTGYLIRMPNNHPTTPTTWTGSFTGVPNNGTVTLDSLVSSKYYAIGNPYPSTISAADFIVANNLTEALYFWRKTNGAQTSSYATYTLAGGASNSGGDPLGLTPNGFIQVGQGFIAKTPASSTSLSFTNSMRRANNGNQFFRMTEDRSRIWLNMTNNADYFGQTLIAYMPDATLGIDAAIDGRYINDFGTALTSLIDSEEFSIQGRPLPFETTDAVALGFKSMNADSYTISLSQIDGLFETQGVTVFLKDNLANTVHNLSESPYSFATEVGTFNSRFEIVYQEALLGVTPIQFNESQVVIYKTPTDEIVINCGSSTISTIKIFDIQGRLLLKKKDVNSNETICNIKSSTEVLLIQILSKDGIMVTKKVLFPKTALKFNKNIDLNFQLADEE
jgi:hypothetical protein